LCRLGRSPFLVLLCPAMGRDRVDPLVASADVSTAHAPVRAADSRSFPARIAALYRGLAGEALSGAEIAGFAEDDTDRNLRRVRVLAPLMVVLHIAHIAMYRIPSEVHPTLTPEVVRWQVQVMWVHILTLPFAVALTAAVYLVTASSKLGRLLTPLAAVLYLCHGAMATGVDQIASANVNAFTGYAFGIAVICAFPLRKAWWIYAIGTATVMLAVSHYQIDPGLRLSTLLNMMTVGTTSIALNVLLNAGRRRDFRQRRIIASQRDELAHLNADLEHRVDEQVAEIVRRAEQVTHLNAQLQSQIRQRSSELQAALARLAAEREDEGVLRPGTVIGDRFEIRGKIGAGGMGVVYSGRDRITSETVAIKVVRPGETVGIDAIRRFLGEAGAVANISHPAVVRMINVDVTADGYLYQAQELVDGCTLDNRVEEDPWPEADVARLGSVLCAALAAAHERGIVHRDVKPANIMLTANQPGLKLLDFGLAKLFEGPSPSDEHATGSRLIIGTPAYMAPEQVLAGDVTAKADVYAVGVLLFQLLTGKLAFEVDGASRVMMKHVQAQAPDVRTHRPEVRGELATMIAACLSKHAIARPGAHDLSVRLGGFADAHGARSMEEIGERNSREPAPADPVGRTSGSIARRMRGFGSVVLFASLLRGV
jgi:hypothetical protein